MPTIQENLSNDENELRNIMITRNKKVNHTKEMQTFVEVMKLSEYCKGSITFLSSRFALFLV